MNESIGKIKWSAKRRRRGQCEAIILAKKERDAVKV